MLPAKMICSGMSIIFLTLFSITSLVERGEALAVMSIDLGSEWMKVAIVSPGVPMEIVLNKESKRKTPATIAFRNGERTFGEDAKSVGFRSPSTTFSYLLDLVGKPIDHPMVQLFSQRFPHYRIVADTERDTISFTLDGENTVFTPEELIAQLLHKGKEFAEISANQRISEVVITVPGFFNQAERRAIMQAAELVDLKVLQLMNDYTAVALNYAISRRKEINDTAHYVIFYDMGAGSTTATVVSYQNVKTKEKGFVETHPQVNILGVGYDRTLGGLEMQIRLRNYLAEQFDAMNKTPHSVFKSPRAMNKLFEEAGQVKNILSANADHYAQIEGVIDEQDFKLQVTRDKFEELCADLFERVANPIKMALETSALTMDLISQVVLVGAGTRVPKVQDTLSEFVKMQLSKNLNTDEAAALGAAYKAADLSQGFKVKKFVTKDAVTFPIQVVFDRIAENNAKKFRRTLFSRMNSYPQKKIITFNKHTDNFSFDINYAELDYLPPHEVAAIGNLNISTVTLTGVPEALKKHAAEGAESKGIKAHFAMDESGLLNLLGVDLVSEKANVAASEEEGTFSKLGSTISKLFTGSEDKENVEKVDDTKKEDIKPVHEEPEYSELNKDKEETNKKNDTKPSEEPVANKTEKAEKSEKEKKLTTIILKEPIMAQEIKLGPKVLDEERFQKSYEKIQKLQQHDLEKIRRDTAFHSLESFVIEVKLQLESEEIKPIITPEEAEQIEKRCIEISNWLYDEGSEESAEVYEETLKEIQKLTQNLYEKVHEHKERPEALKGLSSMLNRSRTFLNSMKNLSLSSEIFTKVEIDMLEKVINETEEFYKTVVKHYKETPLHHPIKYKVRDITAKMDTMDREVKYLINKAKIWRSKHEAANANQTEKKVEGEKKIVVEEPSENEGEKTVGEEKIPSESQEEKEDSLKDSNSNQQESVKKEEPEKSKTDDKTTPSAEEEDVHVDL